MQISSVNGFYVNTMKNYKSFKGNEEKKFNLDAFSESGGDFYPQADDYLDRWIAKIYSEEKGIPTTVDSNPESLIGKTITDLYLEHFQSLPNNSYSGENLMRKPEHYFTVIKQTRIHNVIDILDEGKAELEERCQKYGIDYHHLPFPWNIANMPIFNDDGTILEKERKYVIQWETTPEGIAKSIERYKNKIAEQRTESVRKLAEYIDIVNKGNFYVSCENGEYRTKNFLALVSLFNPKWSKERKIDPAYAFAENVIILYKNLTNEHKQILGITADYDEFLKDYIKDLAKQIGKYAKYFK